jgi:cytochrome c556
MTSAMSFDPAAVVRLAMEEEIQRLSIMRDEVDLQHPDAEPYKQKINIQIEDIRKQLEVMAKKAPKPDDSAPAGSVSNEKSDVRNKVWEELRKVALPDSRFHCKSFLYLRHATSR